MSEGCSGAREQDFISARNDVDFTNISKSKNYQEINVIGTGKSLFLARL